MASLQYRCYTHNVYYVKLMAYNGDNPSILNCAFRTSFPTAPIIEYAKYQLLRQIESK